MKKLTDFPPNRKFQYGNLKITIIAFIFSVFSINAGNSQGEKISLSLSDTQLEKVFQEIERTTEYNIFYENTSLDLKKNVSINVKDLEIGKVLEIILNNTNISYIIRNYQIILTPKVPVPSGERSVKAKTDQQRITGTVVDNTGMPLLGATVLVKGTNMGTTVDLDGRYELTVPANATTLVFSYVGFLTREVEIGTQTTIDVVLQADDSLDEVVVIGYGTSQREDIIGSVGVVDMKNIESQAPTVNLDQALQGQVAGLYVSGSSGQPGAPARVRIRGTTSLQGSNQPLYVIDGIPVVAESNIPIGGAEGQMLGNALAQEGLNTPIGNINTSDIKSITVLKDASAGAIYGSRAANGVIIIETKSGVYSQGPQFSVDYSLSTQKPRTLEVLNAQQFREVTTTAVQNGTLNTAYTQSVLDGSYFGNADTNWEEVIAPSNPVTSNLNLNIQGGSESTRYYAGIGANQQEGSFEGSNFDRYSFKLNLDTEISRIWNFGVRSNLSYTDQNALDGSLTERMYIFRPDIPVFNEEGEYSFSPGYNLESPAALAQATNANKTLLVLSSFFTELKITNGLVAKSLLSVNYNNGEQKSFYPLFTSRGGWGRLTGPGDGYAQESTSVNSNVMWENTLRYNNLFNDVHRLDAVIGASFEQNNTSQVKAWGTGFFNNVLTNISNATISRDGASLKTAYGLESYFGRLNYDFDSRYLLSLSARVDGSSKFAKENTHAFFPAVALGWRLSEEEFLKDSEVINELKFRTSWGVTGQQDFGPYQWRTLYETDDYGGAPSIVLSQLGNDRLKWEKTKQFDIGIDFSFFNNRLNGGIGYYGKNTEDAIFTVTAPGNTGFSSVLANVGSTKNSGYELELRGSIIRKQDFNWDMAFNASTNKNKLVSLSDDFKDDEGFITGFPGGGFLREGSPIGLIYGYRNEGIFQTQGEIDALNAESPTGNYQAAGTSPGDMRFSDLNGDGVVNAEDQEIIGDTQPDFFGGFSNTLTYKGFSLNTLFNYSVGNDLNWFNQSRSINFGSTFTGENKTTEVLNAWTPNNPTNQPRLVFGDPNSNARVSSYYVYDASYLRLKSLTLRYTFNERNLDWIGFLKSASIYMTGQNLLTITNYPGADPEASNLYNNDISSGRDNNRFPVAKVFTAGVRIGF